MLYKLDSIQPTVPNNGEYWVADNAAVIGNVTLEKDSSVWFATTIRGDNDPIVIGQGSNIQDNSVIHTDHGFPTIIGKNVTVGHSVMLHGCKIGDNSLVGIGSVVMNGVELGENCLVGSNSLLTQGKKFPPNSLIMGAPAKVVRELTEDEKKMLLASADVYIKNSQRFKQGLAVVK